MFRAFFFRSFIKEKADELGLVGWARNAQDRTVEVVVQGSAESLTKFKKWCITGPSHADVDRVEEEWKDIEKVEFEKFAIVYE